MHTPLSRLYLFCILSAASLALARYKRLDAPSKMICHLVWLGLFTEMAGWCAGKYYRNNYPVYNVAFYLEYFTICLYFRHRIPQVSITYFAAAGGAFMLLNSLCFQSYRYQLQSHFLFFECLVTVGLCMFSLYALLLREDDPILLHQRVHFWIPFILLFYQISGLSVWGFYNLFGQDEPTRAALLNNTVLLINMLTYMLYSLLLIYYPKLKTDDTAS